jgi:adenylate cyclase
MGANSQGIYKFGLFDLDLEQRLLFRSGDSVPLTPKAFDTLAALVTRPGRVIDKAQLISLVWPDTFVEDNNLTQNISALRRVFGDQDYIETIPRRGYRFTAHVDEVTTPEKVSPLAPSSIPSPPKPTGFRKFWIGAILAAAAAVALALFFISKTHGASHPVDSLVVLPFVNLTANPEDEYFSDGLTEELTNAVAHLDGLRVVARTSAFQFKGKAPDIRAIARQLDVGTVLEGSVRRQGKQLRVTVQLNDAQSGYHIWSQTYDRDLGDIFRIQEDISSQVARTLRPGDRAIPAAPVVRDREVYNLYLLGRFHREKSDSASIKKGIGDFEEALDKDPNYAAAWAGLAEGYVRMAQENYMPPVEAWAAAQKALSKSLALDNNLSEAHTTQAIVYLLVDRNWDAAEKQFRQAIALNENDAAAHHWFSHYFIAMGRSADSLRESQTALKLDPLNVQISGHLIYHYLRARDFPNAIRAGMQALDLDPHSQQAYLFLTWAYEDTAQWENAIEASQLGREKHPEAAVLRAAVRTEGPRGYWRVNQEFLSKQENPENFRLALYHARLGQTDEALTSLELSLQKHEPELVYVKREPAFDQLHGNPRFIALTQAMRLP